MVSEGMEACSLFDSSSNVLYRMEIKSRERLGLPYRFEVRASKYRIEVSSR